MCVRHVTKFWVLKLIFFNDPLQKGKDEFFSPNDLPHTRIFAIRTINFEAVISLDPNIGQGGRKKNTTNHILFSFFLVAFVIR